MKRPPRPLVRLADGLVHLVALGTLVAVVWASLSAPSDPHAPAATPVSQAHATGTGDTSEVAIDPSVAVAATIDWDSLVEGDTVPLEAFPAPAVTAKPAHRLQVASAKKRGGDYVSIPSMNAVAPIEVSHVNRGEAGVPEGGKVGWLNVSKKPGSRHGVTVLAGHRDVRKGANAGPLYGAEHLKKGATIKVSWKGKTTTYRVAKVTKHPRHKLPPTLLDPNGKGRIALTTCTGPYVLGKDGQFWLSRNAVIWATRVRS